MKTVLIVDDNKEVALFYQSILNSSNIKCNVANGGEECLEILRDKSFDLILLDLAMPGMSGVELLEKLRKDPILNGTKVVIITALSPSEKESDDIKQKYNVLSVVKKPINRNQLLQIVDNA